MKPPAINLTYVRPSEAQMCREFGIAVYQSLHMGRVTGIGFVRLP